jgi:dolichol-phosphate mannosyltransferase
MRTIIILPTYNELENIVSLSTAVLAQSEVFDVLVVDDNSPDKTSEEVQNFINSRPQDGRMNLIIRDKKDGRGGAVRRGLEWAISSNKYDAYVEMDCDFSHPPTDIQTGVNLLKTNDVVLGCRYPNGKIIGWPFKRRVLSYFANILARALISRRITDYTGGFRFYNASAAKFLCSLPQKNKGYIYLSETLAHLLSHKFKIGSFPIIFVNRERGVSNTGFMEVFDSLKAIFLIGFEYKMSKIKSAK